MIVLLLLVSASLYISMATDVHIYVSPQGSDKNNGQSTRDERTTTTGVFLLHPVRKLTEYGSRVLRKATLCVCNQYGPRSACASAQYVVYIELMTGHYDLSNTLVIARNKVVIRAFKDQEVHVTGGKRVPSSSFKTVTDPVALSTIPVTSHAHVRVAHLPDIGISEYGTMSEFGGWARWTAPLEVFYNAKPLRFARWPDEGFINIVDFPDGKEGLRFRYNSTIPKSWQNEADIWVYGYWYWSWADRSIKVKSLDVSSKTVTLTEHPPHGLRTGHWNDPVAGGPKQGGYFRFINVMSALDQPGEYYMDREHGNLYVWFPSKDGNASETDVIYLSLINNCVQLNEHVQHITLEGFTIEACRGNGVVGTNVHNIQLKTLEIKNTGGPAVLLDGDCRDCFVTRCLIHDTGGGLFVNGGNRQTLESSGNTIENNEIFEFSRVGAVGYHGISVVGVGHVVRYNHLYHGQWTGLLYYGNDITMEHNLIHHVCVNASDCGAFHIGGDWTTRGNIIRYNIVHDVLRLVPGADVRGVMLDDQSSSTSITNNVFYNNDVHANIGGGRYNIITNNVLYNATSHSIQVDSRGTSHTNDKILITHLHAVPYNSSVWTLRYPELSYLNLQNASLPEGNQIVKNLVFNGHHADFVYRYDNAFNKPRFFNISETGFSLGKTDHVSTEMRDLRLKCYAAEWANRVNFEQVPSPNDVGPRVTVGPTYLHRGLSNFTNLTVSSDVCSTQVPATDTPVAAYLPDGSNVNGLYNVSNEGCWFIVSGCTDDHNAVGMYRDTYGETHDKAAINETKCFQRAVAQWKYCGSHNNEQVTAIYGPSGATRLVGDGCFMAMYGCPKHGGPADGHVMQTGLVYRDTWAEQNQNASHDEERCLSRAFAQWKYCGSNRNHPITSIYRPAGSVRTAGAGCWVHVQKCPKHPEIKSMFYDAWGASNYKTDVSAYACFYQAEYYWIYCGSDVKYPVTAYHRPSASSKTCP